MRRKKPPFSHQEDKRPSPRRFCSGQLLTRASVENPVFNQATVGSPHLGWQITALAATIPNAARTLSNRTANNKEIHSNGRRLSVNPSRFV